MKKLFKSKEFIISAMLLMTFVTWAAISATVYSPASGKTSVVAAPVTTTSFTFNNTNSALTATVYVYDAPGTNVTYVVGGYSNFVYSAGYITNSWTNYLGVVNSNVYLAAITTTNSIAQTTNYYPTVGIFLVGSNGSASAGLLTANLNYNFKYGILVTNDRSVSTTVNYSGQ